VTKSKSTKFEKNIYVERRSGAYRFIVAVHPLPKDSATFSSIEEGAVWARRRRVELLEEKAGASTSTSRSLSTFQNFAPQAGHVVQVVQPETISLSNVFDVFEENELEKLAGAQAEASRLRRLRQWFGELTLGQLDYCVLEKWKIRRLSGVLGSGRNPCRGTKEAQPGEPQHLTKHQRHYRKKSNKAVPVEPIRPLSPQTARHEIVLLRRAIKAFFRQKGLMRAHGAWLQTHPVMETELPQKALPRKQRLSDEDVKSVIANMATQMLKSAILFALSTTLRCSEIVSLRWEHVDFKRKVIQLMRPGHIKKSKTHSREVPLLPAAIKILNDLGPEKNGPIFPITASGLSQAWRRAADAAGIYDARLHDCRREAISRLIEKCNVSLSTVAVFSGHSDFATLQRHYVRPNAAVIASQIAEIPGSDSIVPSL
jgi:integrase